MAQKKTYCSCSTTSTSPSTNSSSTTCSTPLTGTTAIKSFDERRSFFGANDLCVPCSTFTFVLLIISCPHCNALHWKEEALTKTTGGNLKYSMCCSAGAVRLPIGNDTPEPIRTLLTETRVNANGKVVWTERTSEFQHNIRSYNNSVSFTSLGAKLDRAIVNTLHAQGIYTFRIQCALHHSMGSLLPPPGERPRFAQVYLYDSAQEQIQFRHETHPNLDLGILALLTRVLRDVNPLVQYWRTARERITENEQLTIRLKMLDPKERDPRRYNRPTADEVAAIIVRPEDDNEPFERDIVIQHRNTGRMQHISQHSPAYMSLRYPFFFPYGEKGWHTRIPLADNDLADNINLQAHRRTHIELDDDGEDNDVAPQHRRGRGGSTRVSQSQYYAFQFQNRDGIFSPILHGGRLCQEYIVDAWVCTESNRLNWAKTHQAELRADCYNGLQDAMGGELEHDARQLGRRIILPSTIPGTPRHMKQLYQDSMAICRHYGRADFFITFTCNPKWDEITANLPPGFSSTDRPDIVARVFNLKLKALLDDLLTKHVLGKPVADVYTIEFQKRGLPHAHILLILNDEDKIRDVEFLDTIICAEIPDRNVDRDLYNVVTSNMLHGPCGVTHPKSPCMMNGKCSKRFPKQFSEETMAHEDGYPIYRRREKINGEERKVQVKGIWLDNRWVVPYNPYVSKRYKAHINVELCSSIGAFKYLFKYVFKGGDRTTAILQTDINGQAVPRDVDEIADYLDARYVSAPEGGWRMFQFKMHHRYPAVQRLQIHLPNQQTVTFSNDTDMVTFLNNDRLQKTTLTEFFTANKQAARVAPGPPTDDNDCRKLLYQEFPTKMTWNRSQRRWTHRKSGFGGKIGRIYFVGPSGSERFYRSE